MRLEAGITAAGNGGLHTELRVAGAAKKIFYFFSKKRYTFKKIKHIIYASEKSERTAPVGLAKAGIVVSGYLHM